jgi:hypothetical protein
MAQLIKHDPIQEERRTLWVSIATNPGMGWVEADIALAAYDARFNPIDAVQAEPDRPALSVVELVLRGPSGSGKSILLQELGKLLPDFIQPNHGEAVKLVFAEPGASDGVIRKLAGGHNRILLIRDDAE